MTGFWGCCKEKQFFISNGQAFIPRFDDIIREIGKGYDDETGIYKCNESAIWFSTWALNISNINVHHQGAILILHTSIKGFIFYPGSPSNNRSVSPPAGGLNNTITFNGSIEFPVDIKIDPRVWLEIRINGDDKQKLEFLPSSYFSISKQSKISK